MSNARITDALARSVKVRSMLKSFLEELEPEKWYWQPGEGINHVAWQVGHLAFAQYGLCLKRVRGVAPEDEGMIPSAGLAGFAPRRPGSMATATSTTPMPPSAR